MQNGTRVVVTGLGAITPVGNDVPTTWQNLIAGKSGIARITLFDAANLATKIAGEVKNFDARHHFEVKEARRLERFVHLATVAAREAIADAHLDITDHNRERIAIIIGSGVGGAMAVADQAKILETKGPRRVSPFFIPMILSDTAPGHIAIEFGITGPNMAVVSACATGANALGEAAAMIARGDAEVAICGGVEACLHPLIFAGFNTMGVLSTRNDEPTTACRPFDATRDGFVMSEGAGVLVLENAEYARARRENIRRGNRLRHKRGREPRRDARAGRRRHRTRDEVGTATRAHRTARGRVHQRARHRHAAQRSNRNDSDQTSVWRRRVRDSGRLDEIYDRTFARRRGRGRIHNLFESIARTNFAADDQLRDARPRM